MKKQTFKRRDMIKATGALAVALALSAGVQAQSGGELLIGGLVPVTGAGAPYGGNMLKAMEIGVKEVNDAGGMAGRSLRLIAEDSQTQPQAAVLAAKKLIEINKVQAILGTWASGVTLAVLPLTDAANIIQMNVSGAPAISEIDKKDLVWRFQATNDRFGRAFAEIAAKNGYKKPATMAFNNASGRGNTDGFIKAWEAKGGKVLANVVYEPNRSSYRSELQKVLATDPDVIVMGSYLPDTTIILREWFQSGAENAWIIPGWAANPELVQALGQEVTDGIISVDTVSNSDADSYTDLNQRYRQATGADLADNVYAAMTYDMVISLALAAHKAGADATPQQISDQIRAVSNPDGEKVYSYAQGKALLDAGKDIDYEGASSRLNFDEYGDSNPDFGVYAIRDGKFERVDTISLD
ncbi:ABC transporter substrate-binding protein [Kerstersia gyiorum]|uniref:ABC transporter substrate-binding protein n=1 Tax=Kerstersia gyiorum TaxID=206506 RepID=UPI0020A005C7|nr:ABC transporter substrate-binding protein [Kerstersia gyiorum]MCP1634664.1 branched-chain amino acid transport system substrate-binding protein [Kerstersia gyiorum]MCP1683731.1 branched-chain amino acid transport system substrate-binding protein [Kerstersia gyiorum]MCP1719401.1 branched-chain amino acid transport system substrate-binding protein [Kerstersia gyiorum]MCW2188239.1 branched-chain amino acid transport system substrate-binding protein [Kerstersia gyiorum]